MPAANQEACTGAASSAAAPVSSFRALRCQVLRWFPNHCRRYCRARPACLALRRGGRPCPWIAW
eukprot:5641589-Prorocentrum_lima.AAC.1